MIAPPSALRCFALSLLGVLALLLGVADRAAAHTGFESSDPADGETVDAPVETITITFTGDAAPAGDGFVVLDPAGVVRQPDAVDVAENRIFTLRFDPPLAGGPVGVRWSVQAPDTHPIEGSFSFVVDAPAPTTTNAAVPATTVAPATTAAPAADVGATAPPNSTAAAANATSAPATDAPVAAADPDSGSGVAGATSLEEFLAVDHGGSEPVLSSWGRGVGLLGVALAIGGIGFVAVAWRGSTRELGELLWGLRLAGGLLALGALAEYIGFLRAGAGAFGSGLFESPGAAMALRFLGGVAVAVGVRGPVAAVPAPLSAAVVDAATAEPPVTRGRPRRWHAASSPVALAGALLAVVSFWFDGHTVSEGLRPLHAIVNSVHVLAGSIWVGGVVTFAVVVALRRRRGVRVRAGELIVRFSSIATVALVAVVAAGIVMSVMIIDGWGDLTGTEWGQVLLLKTAAVTAAAAVGAYNHLVLRPLLRDGDADLATVDRLRSALVVESVFLLFVVVVTGALVTASTVG